MGLIGKTVFFSIDKERKEKGEVLDKINLMSSSPTCSITGYIILSEDGTLYNSISHWRILEVVK